MSKEDYKRFTQADFDYSKEKETKNLPIYFVYPNYVEELKAHRIPLSPDIQDTELTNFLTRVDEASIEKTIPTVVRLRNVNKKGLNKGKKTEYMIWYENWSGTDTNGHIIAPVSDLPKGIDKGVDFSKNIDNTGVEHFKPEREYWIYTQEFDPNKLDEILADTNTDPESVQYIVMGIRSWGGFSYEEFRNLSYEEICERGRTGQVQKPVIQKVKK